MELNKWDLVLAGWFAQARTEATFMQRSSMQGGAMRCSTLMSWQKLESRALFTGTHGGTPFQPRARARWCVLRISPVPPNKQ